MGMQAYAASSKGVVHGGRRSNCPNTTTVPNTYDWAFGGGQLTLSALSTVGITSRGQAQGTMAKKSGCASQCDHDSAFCKTRCTAPGRTEMVEWCTFLDTQPN